MLLYHRVAPPKVPKRRSRAGCIHCKEKKKKCNEARPQCDRCAERNLACAYEPVRPRKQRRPSAVPSILRQSSANSLDTDAAEYDFLWPEADINDDGEDIEEVIRGDLVTTTPPSTSFVCSNSVFPDLAMIAPSDLASPLSDFCPPAFYEFSTQRNRRLLVDHFGNVLSHLIVLQEDAGNPFRELVLPLCLSSQPMLNAVFALSSAHLEYRGHDGEEKSLDFHSKALQGVAQLIAQNEPQTFDEVLGAIILLIYYEVLVRRGNSNIVASHLRAALAVMRSEPQPTTPASQFLERAFGFYDVIAALSSGAAPVCNTPCLIRARDEDTPPAATSIDTLLGMATDLWPIIHRLSRLVEIRHDAEQAAQRGKTAQAETLADQVDVAAAEIESALLAWAPVLPSPRTDHSTQSVMHNAEAYRHAALVYLYRVIRARVRADPAVQQHTTLALAACRGVVQWAGPMGALLWPLFVASCEAMSVADRAVAREVYSGIETRQGMVNIVRAWEVVEEVWRRVDGLSPDATRDVDWRDVAQERGVNIIFG